MITVIPHFETDESMLPSNAFYFPIDPCEFDDHRNGEWELFDLEKLVFTKMSRDWPEESSAIGKRLVELGESAIINAYGPIEGVYYAKVDK